MPGADGYSVDLIVLTVRSRKSNRSLVNTIISNQVP